ncbi:DUF3108 domain-containing protein [Alkalimarinus alittae]|uniref:DUF3108 domain-containing protein n=1 Tax=Alkalimarinus alittae TaxID=2961619 RepID=A0ABY6MYT1_9ALTE|nr:DUF3108 domain-containing protein [Alkalimarinus alittae]UZE95006.1 DUF3108 domain-containing protein [Alkalimarinus alittae]
MRQLVIAILISLFSTPLLLNSTTLYAFELKPSKAKYSASFKSGIPINGTATHTLIKLSNNIWRYQFNVDSFFADVNEFVYFQYTDGKVVPITYHYERNGWAVNDRRATLEFNWNEHKVLNDVQGIPWSMGIPDNAVDKLGYQLQIKLDLMAGKEDLVYQVADGGYLKEFHFSIEGEETIKTELGKVTAVVVKKVRSESDNRDSTLWFAKELDYLLVKLIQIEADGERYEINIKSVTDN